MEKKINYFMFFGVLVLGLGGISLKLQLPVGPVLLILTLFPLAGLLISGRKLKRALPDLLFGGIDTGLLTIPALGGGIMFGVPGAIAGGIIGDSVTDGIAGFFEGSLEEWLRKKKIEAGREPLVTSLGKMAGCLLGSGLILTIAYFFGIQPQLQ